MGNIFYLNQKGIKLDVIGKALESNPNVIVVDAKTVNSGILLEYSPNFKGFIQTVDFRIAPRSGLYAARELQAFMESLFPYLNPTIQENFSPYGMWLKLGKLYFDEIIAKMTVDTEIELLISETDGEILKLLGLMEGSSLWGKKTENQYARRIWVKPFPNEELARASLKDSRLEDRISLDLLSGYLP